MRKPTQFRLLFLMTAIASYVLGSYLMPEALSDSILSVSGFLSGLQQLNQQALGLTIATLLFFIAVPVAYWFWVIKKNEQGAWRLLIAFSLSSMVARYQYPDQIAQYFDFIVWLRYPLIAVLLIIEFYLMFMIGRSLWQMRKLVGDPRLKVLSKYEEGSKERNIGLMLAFEPAAWYYAIPRFSRNHVPSIAQLKLLSSHYAYFLPTLIINISLIFISYFLLSSWSTLAALVVSTCFFSSTLMFIANFRCSKYHSMYILHEQLIINNSWWGFMAIDISDINACKLLKAGEASDDVLQLGRGQANLQLTFTKKQIYYTCMAQFSEKASTIALGVDDPKKAAQQLGLL